MLAKGSYKIPAALDEPFKTDGKYPIIIFSHGLGAFRYVSFTEDKGAAWDDIITILSTFDKNDNVLRLNSVASKCIGMVKVV